MHAQKYDLNVCCADFVDFNPILRDFLIGLNFQNCELEVLGANIFFKKSRFAPQKGKLDHMRVKKFKIFNENHLKSKLKIDSWGLKKPNKWKYKSFFYGEDITTLVNDYICRKNSLYLVDVQQDLGICKNCWIVLKLRFKKDGQNGPIFEKVIRGGHYPLVINYLTHFEMLNDLHGQLRLKKIY